MQGRPAHRYLRRNVVVRTLLLLPPLNAASPDARAVGTSALTAGVTIEGRFTVGDVHTYRAELDAGVWRLRVTQHGVDTVADVVLPDGVRLGPFNGPAGRRGTEAFVVTLDVPGVVDVEIRARARRSAARGYTLVLERLAAAAAEPS